MDYQRLVSIPSSRAVKQCLYGTADTHPHLLFSGYLTPSFIVHDLKTGRQVLLLSSRPPTKVSSKFKYGQ